ncbi:hypothetical protein BDK51DRAFT_48367 [Blyttiomyces helicus]|uniref:Uncharacterized protein n=1 Tax=Blyttiomyces helicus TaxID=388810 RepID=A0A4P9W030_9FUNG|nr:hypothetical protein BDK51DRAFT_48367 [Blyttiomyces helicus]|eukprot:RKO85459.1 hypothetical protein BDK51DRAFT_48367 [Blyttiomyces helicus]
MPVMFCLPPSPLAPPFFPSVFWIYHSNVDRIYHDVQISWQGMNLPQEKQIYGNSYLDVNSESLTLKTPLPYFIEYTVDDVQFSAQMCVQYVQYAPPRQRRACPATCHQARHRPCFEKFTAAFWEKILVGRTPEQRAAHAASFEQFMADTEENVASGNSIDGNVPRSSMRIKNGRSFTGSYYRWHHRMRRGPRVPQMDGEIGLSREIRFKRSLWRAAVMLAAYMMLAEAYLLLLMGGERGGRAQMRLWFFIPLAPDAGWDNHNLKAKTTVTSGRHKQSLGPPYHSPWEVELARR